MNNNPPLTDEELLRRYKADNNGDWIGILFDRYAVLLLGMCMKYLKNEEDARDSVQQVFLKVLSEINRHEIQYFRAWIYQVARNHCLMQLRQKHVKYQEEISDKHMPAAPEPEDLSGHKEKDQLLENMEQALDRLNEEQRTCIRLFYLSKLSYQQIADKTGYTLLQVKSYIQNGKRNLKQLLEKQPSHKR
ncbi:RNA polymerase sigma factor [Chitinophaga japonensis]|uniref:RNA polymerase sigma-70 factor (ECF subfamily) n=1 Tax=Chitinophaga japonensis TaxID=104662 RepID=A0A562T6J4_CHIJA|nr:sigma-70 family RNA polymerase sigma factor [Chitinophaga japonensis]TWI89112.1 RNA polymerase sigma-70 factor (ECF subfamily) [Chitinophaga japonensis]